MPALDTLGMPVEVSAIAKELKKLWSADQTRTRATMFNFAIVCEGEAAMQENTELLQRFVGSHSFRALLIGIEPSNAEPKVRAWINAHCYQPKAGAKHVCSEQVSLYLTGKVHALLANLLFSQLDSDLPLTLWWRGENFDHVDPEVWRWVDRLIIDTQTWAHPREQLSVLRRQIGTHRIVLCDLAWTRTLHLRQSLAQMFDTGHASALAKLRRLKVTHAPGAHGSAVLLLGWFAAQLGWYAHGPGGNHVRFSGEGRDVICDLSESAGPAIGRVEIECETLTVVATRKPDTSFLQISVRETDGTTLEHLMPADCDCLAALLDEELSSGGRHRVYLKALAAAEPLL